NHDLDERESPPGSAAAPAVHPGFSRCGIHGVDCGCCWQLDLTFLVPIALQVGGPFNAIRRQTIVIRNYRTDAFEPSNLCFLALLAVNLRRQMAIAGVCWSSCLFAVD